MKKSLLVISVILLIAGLFISCNSEAAGSEEDLVYVTFEDEGKGLSSSITTWEQPNAPSPDSLKWYYKASKASGAQVGAKSSWTPVKEGNGLTGTQIGPFSVGNWKFEVIGCDPDLVPTSATVLNNGTWNVQNKVRYAGVSGSNSHTEATNVKLVRGTTATIPVAVKQFNAVTASPSVNLIWNVSYLVAGAESMYYKVSINGGETTYNNSVTTSEILSMNSLQYSLDGCSEFTPVTVKFEVYDAEDASDSDLKVAENSVTFPGLKGSTVTISGTLDDLGYAYGEFGDPEDLTSSTPTVEACLYDGEAYSSAESFDSAYVNAQSGNTIILLDNITFGTDRNVSVWEKNVNLDLGGHTFTTNSEQSSGASNNGYYASAICYGNSGSRNVTVSNGTIRTKYGAGIYAADGTTLTIKDVNIHQNYPDFSQTTNEYSSAIRVTEESNVTIESGSFYGMYAVVVSNSGGIVTINGGTFAAPLYFSTSTDSGVTKTITITGGAFTNFSVVNSDKGTIAISGGTFDADPSDYVDTTYYNVSHSGSTYTVTPKN